MKNLFPYKPRRGQISIMENIYNIIQNENIIMINAPTGLGKTICSLVPTIKSGKKILFVTPRQSQHKIVIQSCKDINREISIASIIGKKDMCDNEKINTNSNFYDMCTLARKKNSKIPCTLFREKRCRYYNEIEKAKDADVITANYRHVFSPDVSDAFLHLTEFNTSDMILIIDEAHNLPSVLRDIASTKITNRTCERAQNELNMLEMASFDVDYNLAQEIANVIATCISFSNTKRRMDKDTIEVSDEALSWLKRGGEKVIEIKSEDGMVAPVSSLLSLYNFFVLWRDVDDIAYIRIFDKYSGNWSLSIKCLEPEMLNKPLFEYYSTILMSGTLQPLDYFKNVLGLPDSVIMKSYPSIYPPENKVVVMENKLSTQYKLRTPTMYINYGKKITEICNHTDGNVVAFFPSYILMKEVKSHIKTNKKIITENSEQKIDVHTKLKSRNNLLLGVMRGTLAEGVDYKDNLLSAIVINGLPFPMQDIELNALTNYYDNKYGNGFVYASLYPTINVVLQAVGRGIRSETDKCTIYMLDKRFNRYKKWF